MSAPIGAGAARYIYQRPLDGWERIRRACEREAVRRAWGAFWREAEAAAQGRGDGRRAEGYRRMARRAEKRAARIRRAVLNGGRV